MGAFAVRCYLCLIASVCLLGCSSPPEIEDRIYYVAVTNDPDRQNCMLPGWEDGATFAGSIDVQINPLINRDALVEVSIASDLPYEWGLQPGQHSVDLPPDRRGFSFSMDGLCAQCSCQDEIGVFVSVWARSNGVEGFIAYDRRRMNSTCDYVFDLCSSGQRFRPQPIDDQ